MVPGVLKKYRRVIRSAGLEWEDAAQSAWLAFYRAARSYAGYGNLGGYLWECVRRAVLAEVRTAGARGFTWTGGQCPANEFRFLPAAESVSGSGQVWVDDRRGRRAIGLPAPRPSKRVYWTWDQWDEVLKHLARPEAAVIRRKYRDGDGTKRGWDMGPFTPYRSKRLQASAFERLRSCPALAEYRPD